MAQRGHLAAKFFIGGISVLGLLLFAYSAYEVAINPFSTEWLLLCLVTTLLVSRLDIEIPNTTRSVTVSDTFLFLSVLLYGTYPSVVLAGMDAAICSAADKDRVKALPFRLAAVSLSVFVAGSVTSFAFGDISQPETAGSRLILAAGLLALIHFALNSGLVSVAQTFLTGNGLLTIWRESFLWTSISYVAGAVAAVLIIKLIAVVSFSAFIVAVPVLTIAYFTYKIYLDKVETSNRHAEQMADLHLRTIEALAIAIDAKDEVTHEHVRRVQIYATGLAALFGLSEPEIEALKAGALLHDIGKLAVPDYILNKPGRLTPAEFEKMKIHTVVGAEILERVNFPYPVVPVVRHHHERWDGRGYPDGLKGDQIPMTARILTVSDSFDSMREERQYRHAMTREEAIAVLKEGTGTVFDPMVVKVFLDHLDEFDAEIREQHIGLPGRKMKQNKEGNMPAAADGGMAFRQIRDAHREVITLYDIAQTISNSLDLRDTFAVFSARLEDIVSYTTCVLYLVKDDSTDVEAAHAAGRHAEKFKGRRLPSGVGITGWVVANSHPLHNCDPRLDVEAMQMELPEPYRVGTVVPLMKDDKMLGALALYSADLRSYDPDHLRLVEAVAKLASDAIANAVRHERSEASALTDPITGLPNARSLRHRFEEQADRSRRHRDTFAVMMMDLDGFKTVNDRFGHQAGDHLLRDMARLMLTQIRSSDFLCRYAGDEFVAVLQVNADEARDLAHRIQQNVDTRNFGFSGPLIAPTDQVVNIGISIGWACFENDGDTLDELLLAADRAMYANKSKRKSATGDKDNYNTANLKPMRVM